VEKNLTVLGFASRGRVVRSEVADFVAGSPPPIAPFDLVFLDPPYEVTGDELAPVLAALAEPAWTRPGAVVVVERAGTDAAPPWPPGWASTWERCYGDTLVLFASSSEEGA
jgi:16S rRNA (guanine966-N2)-methyltransferase